MGQVIQKGQARGDVCRVVVLEADRRRSDPDPGGHSQRLADEDLGHDDVLHAGGMMFSHPELGKSQLLASHDQFKVLVEALGQRLIRIVHGHEEHPQLEGWLMGHGGILS